MSEDVGESPTQSDLNYRLDRSERRAVVFNLDYILPTHVVRIYLDVHRVGEFHDIRAVLVEDFFVEMTGNMTIGNHRARPGLRFAHER